MEIRNLRTPGLGDSTYVLAHEDIGLVVDPQRDIGRFEAELADLDVEPRYVLETHLHNDYVSGGPALARRSGAELVLPAGSGAAYDHTPAFHTEELAAGAGLTVRPLHTPGHTPEHVSYVILVDGEPVAVFSGGSLLVGSSGRTDLLGPERARMLAALQHGSVQRLAALPGETALYPTHGQGSFCTASAAGRTTSTIAEERRSNPAVAQADRDGFVEFALSGLQPWPTYYAHMGPANLRGPQPMPATDVPLLTAADVADRPADVEVLDARPRQSFAEGHVPGSVGIELEEQFGVWAGWVLDFNVGVQLVVAPGQDVEEAVTQLARIGFDDVRGVLAGLDGWQRSGRPLEGFERASPADLAAALDRGEDRQVLDVRSPAEQDETPLPEALGCYVPELADGLCDGIDRERPVWVVCASGFRSAIAAGLLQRFGATPVVVDGGGVEDVLAARRR